MKKIKDGSAKMALLISLAVVSVIGVVIAGTIDDKSVGGGTYTLSESSGSITLAVDVIDATTISGATLSGTTIAGGALANGKILMGNASGVAAEVTPAGDVTISNAGATAIAADSIVNADVKTTAAIASSKLANDVVRSGETNAVQQLMQAGITADTTGTSIEVVFETVFSAAPTVVVCYNEDPGDVRPAFVLSSSTTNFIATVAADKDINWIAIGAK